MSTVQELVEVLQKIEANPEIEKIVPDSIKDAQGYYSEDDLHPDVKQAISLATCFLVSTDGSCDYANMRVVEQAGYNIYPGEQDSFGWLIGCIRTRKGVISYG